MRIKKKVISALLALIRKMLEAMEYISNEVRCGLQWLKKNPSYNLVIIVVVALMCVYFWSWYRLEQELNRISNLPFKKKPVPYADMGCHFPDVNPYSDVAMRYDVQMPKVVCEGYDWVECNMSICGVTDRILSTMRDIECHYKDIVHLHDHKYVVADAVKVVGGDKYILNKSDHFKVSCTAYEKNSGDKNILNKSDHFKVSCTAYEKNSFGLISSRWHGYKISVRPVVVPPPPPGRETSLNVLVVGFDSTARNGFMRKLPRSYEVLNKELQAVVMEGFNIVGDGTPAALFPILSGKTDIEHDPNAKQRYSKTRYLEPEMLMFHALKKDGYHTAYYEDMPWVGTFQYRYNGFLKTPADHYLRSFFMEETKEGYKWDWGISRRYCVGDKPTFLVMLDLTRQFMKVKGKRFCFTFMADISHDDFNMISTADDDLVEFLRHVKSSGLLEDTLFIVMGDHGPRFSTFRATRQGKIEERMPLMAVILPERLKRERPDALSNLQANAEVLTTPFDIHTTIVDAMGLNHLASDFVAPYATMKRGLSLLKPIPRSRTCEDAAVGPHFCVCLNAETYDVEPSDPMYHRSVDTLVQFINNMTEEKRSQCLIRNLTMVMYVTCLGSSVVKTRAGNDSSNIVYYQVLVTMTPGRAAFEASLQYDRKEDRFIISDKDISRISAYGTEPACVSEARPHLSKYCHCRVRLFSAFNLFKLTK